MHSVDTKSEIVKILHFKQFYKHYVFNEDGDGGRKKVLKNYIDVYVCIDMANLSEAQRAVKEIDSVLLAIFDLDATARNELMGAFKRYRTLTRERDMLRAKLEV